MSLLVVVPAEVPPAWLAGLDVLGEELEIIRGLEQLPDARGPELRGLFSLLTLCVDTPLLARLPGLRVVSNMAVGFDNVDVEACHARGIAVGNTPGVLTDATADLCVTLLLAAARRLPEASLDASEGRWGSWAPDAWLGVQLRGARVGIVGLGKIGFAVAERLRGFGVELCYASRREHPRAQALDMQRLSLDELLASADFVTLHVPLRDETRHLIDAEALAKMKSSAILINTARGDIVDQEALLAALQSGALRGAGLDVTSPEPLPPSHPLFAEARCLITPHIGSATETARRRMAELACENLIAGVRGEPLPFAVPGRLTG